MSKLWSVLAGLLPVLGGGSRSSLAVSVPSGDGVIEAAIQEARASLDMFTKALSQPSPGQSDFSVKVPVREGETTHFLWSQQISFDGSNFSGVLGPEAAGIKGHSPGERVTIASKEIEDWMFVENEKLAGGFSLRAIRKRLSGEARKQFEKSLWFKFE